MKTSLIVNENITIIPAENMYQFEAAKQLFVAYQQHLDADLCFQSFDDELMQLQTMYAAPDGVLLLAVHNGEYIGCVAFRKKHEGICEMKRLYVVDAFKKQGIGRLLVETLIAKSIEAGYKKMILDTLERLKPALQLYHSFGFTQTTAYYHNPLQGVIYMELNLPDEDKIQ